MAYRLGAMKKGMHKPGKKLLDFEEKSSLCFFSNVKIEQLKNRKEKHALKILLIPTL